jgi:hypothetical protein
VENLLPLVYLTAFVGTTFFLFRANYILFMRFVFVPLALGVATVLMLVEKSYPSLSNTLSLGLASGALLFTLVNLYLVLNKLFGKREPKEVLAKVAFNRDYE